ncbi:carboxymuconolactone decarboxylase family protein [Streptomyces sp. AD681]|uniref:carboxymuconolactone decarboxylase family protein n=1 Tax=Streptomyces sp. AD681 TaxID=3019069 RepID=UPI0022F19896|nr:carboxymuconolactone decarboxylase family protein [Streptomyces sp. AD681]MDA5145893.1 carboxymuconolactone decarboxylase family protein [Streptomyces sp. AD681]
MKTVVRRLLRDSSRQVRHVAVVDPRTSEGLVAAVYTQCERDFGVLAPPLALHSAAAAPLAAGWLLLRETLLAGRGADRAVKEAVATVVSRANRCPYCVEVHQAKLDTLRLPAAKDVATEIAEWVQAVEKPGRHRRPAPDGLTPAQAAELFGVAVTFHYLNRMVSVFLGDSPVPEPVPGRLRGVIMRTVARSMSPAGRAPLEPGTSLDLLPSARLPAELSWAEASPAVAGALARATAAVDRAARWVPHRVREGLRRRLSVWDGEPVGPSRAWLDEATGEYPPSEVPVARLVLLTAFAPYQVVEPDVRAFRERHPLDRELIEATSWSALTTAVHVGAGFPRIGRMTPVR